MSTFKNIPTPGSEAWKDNVATTADLPLTNNVTGDKRQVLDTKTIYSWNGSGWTAIASPAAAIAITGLLGDVTATGPGAVNATLKTVNLTPGSFGTASSVPSIAVNGKGLVTSSSNTPIQIAQSQVDSLVTDLAGKQPLLGFTPENVANKAINLTSPDNIKYPTTQAVSTALAGKFNNPTGTAADYIAGDGTIIPFPSVGAADRLVTTGYNATGAPIPKMSVVYLDGPQGNLPKMILAQANNEENSSLTYGITQSAIGNMNSGIIVEAGRLENLDTNVAGWNEGEILYLSPTVPGGITNIKPYAPDQVVFVGVLVRKHPTQGVIQVKIQNGYELDELHNVQILTPPANGAVLAYDSASELWKPSTVKLTKGTKTIFCIDNGDYATGQAAIDAAAAGDTILFGVKQGGWGNLVIPAGKTLSLIGLNNPRYPGTTIQIGSITFSPTTGANPNLNELHLANLYILSPAGTSPITFSGTAPARLRVTGCYIYSNTVTGIVINNTDATFTSARFEDCEIQSSTATNTHISATSRYVTFNRCTFGNGNKVIDVVAGVVELSLCRLEVNSASAIVTASSTVAPTFLSIGSCLIANSTTNGSGVALNKGAPALNFVNLSNVFTIAGTGGFCVSGTGTHAYSYPAFTGANTKFQNTLTNVPLTTTPTISA